MWAEKLAHLEKANSPMFIVTGCQRRRGMLEGQGSFFYPTCRGYFLSLLLILLMSSYCSVKVDTGFR